MRALLSSFLCRGRVPGLPFRAASDKATRADHVAAADRARDVRNWPMAVAGYTAAVALSARCDGIMVQLGHALKENGQHQEAEAAYRTFMATYPEDADVHLQLGHLFMVRGDYEEARAWYQKAYKLADADSSIASDAKRGLDACANAPLLAERKIALTLTDRRHFREAHEKLIVLVEQYGCEDLTGILGNVSKELGRFSEARAYYARYQKQANRLGPDQMFDAALQLGHLAKVQRDYYCAIEHFALAKEMFERAVHPSVTVIDLEREIRCCLGEITKAVELL